jgi:lipid-A-disaccharide synthase
MTEKTVFFSVGDDSGDLHASNLMREVRRLEPEVSFVGFGMGRMRDAGLEELETEDARGSTMWLHSVLRLGKFRRRLDTCREYFDRTPPDVVVLVDYGGFNLYVARAARRREIPVVYYILPQVWAHGRYRLKKIRKWVNRPLVIYPFDPPLYRSYGVEAKYVGHPLFDHLERNGPGESEVARLRKGLDGRPVAFFPGSRRQEVRANLPIMLEAAETLQREIPELSFALVSPEKMRPVVEEILEEGEVEVALPETDAATLAAAAELCITKSGTITLEIAAQGTPMVVFYRVNPLFYFLGAGVMETPYIELVNNLAGRMVVPEKVMRSADPDWVVEQAGRLLGDTEEYRRCRREIERTLEGFAEPGASQQAAREVVEVMRQNEE